MFSVSNDRNYVDTGSTQTRVRSACHDVVHRVLNTVGCEVDLAGGINGHTA
jgi:hypothetical protein